MRLASLDDFARDPVARFVAGPTFAHFCVKPDLWGIIIWGRPSQLDARELGRSLVLELAPSAVPHASLVDASRLDGGDEGAFAALEWYLTRHAEALRERVTRLALLRPKGLRGALVAGMYEVVPRPYPVTVFDEYAAAAEWLAIDDPDHFAAELATMFETASTVSPVASSLRRLLDQNLRGMTVSTAARALAMAERSLQRKLGEAGTTFQAEVADARIRAAKRLMRETDAALTTIALDVGCASLQHFNALFRKRTGMMPSAWRKQEQKAT